MVYCLYIIFIVCFKLSSRIYVTKHTKMIFSLYRAKIRLANVMGYRYGFYYDRYIDDLSLCNNYVETGKILDSPDKGKIIGTTIRMQYKKYMYCSPSNKLNMFTDRGFVWLRKMNNLHLKYILNREKVTKSSILLLPGPNNSDNSKPLRF